MSEFSPDLFLHKWVPDANEARIPVSHYDSNLSHWKLFTLVNTGAKII